MLLLALRSGHYLVTENFELGKRDGSGEAVHHDMDDLGDTEPVIKIFVGSKR